MSTTAIFALGWAVGGAAVGWFYWRHCVGPALYWAGASKPAMRAIQLIGALSIALLGIREVNVAIGHLTPYWLVILAVAMGAVYAAMWPVPMLFLRRFGGIDEREAADRALAALSWAIRRFQADPTDGRSIQVVANVSELLSGRRRRGATWRLMELGLEKAKSATSGVANDPVIADQRDREFLAEAARFWPDRFAASRDIRAR